MWKKASFTVETAYIIPLMLVFISFLLGFAYFTHQQVWCRGAAYESIYYGLQRNMNGKADGRLKERLLEIPLEIPEISAEVAESALSLKAEIQTVILPDVFGEMFTSGQSVSAAKIDPAKIKKAEWILKYTAQRFGGQK